MMQGDQYSIPIHGTGFDIEDVESIEFVIGKLVKSYPDVVTYDSTDKVFRFPITQAETYKMSGKVEAQARVKFSNTNDVIGVQMGTVDVLNSLTRTVL